MLEQGLYAFLAANSGVAALASGRIYPLLLPQEPTLPAITYQRISTVGMGGSHGGANHLNQARVQVNCHGFTVLAAKQLADAVRLALNGYSGSMGSVTVQSCMRANETDLYDAEIEAYRTAADYLIVYEEL